MTLSSVEATGYMWMTALSRSEDVARPDRDPASRITGSRRSSDASCSTRYARRGQARAAQFFPGARPRARARVRLLRSPRLTADHGSRSTTPHVWLKTGTPRPYRRLRHEEFLKTWTRARDADASVLLIAPAKGSASITAPRAHRPAPRARAFTVVGSHDGPRRVERRASEKSGVIRELPPIDRRRARDVRPLRPGPEPRHEAPTVRTVVSRPSGLDQIDRFEVPESGQTLRAFALQDVPTSSTTGAFSPDHSSGALRVGDRFVFSPWNNTGFCNSRVAGANSPPSMKPRLIVRRRHASVADLGATLPVGSQLDDAPSETDVIDARLFCLGRDDLTRPAHRRKARPMSAAASSASHRVSTSGPLSRSQRAPSGATGSPTSLSHVELRSRSTTQASRGHGRSSSSDLLRDRRCGTLTSGATSDRGHLPRGSRSENITFL